MTTSKETLQELNQLVAQINIECSSFHDKVIKVSVTRCNKNLMDLKKICTVLRKQLIAERKVAVRPPKIKALPKRRGRPRKKKVIEPIEPTTESTTE